MIEQKSFSHYCYTGPSFQLFNPNPKLFSYVHRDDITEMRRNVEDIIDPLTRPMYSLTWGIAREVENCLIYDLF